MTASTQETDATLTLSLSASVNSCSENGWSQLSKVKPSHVVLNFVVGSLNVKMAMVMSGMNR